MITIDNKNEDNVQVSKGCWLNVNEVNSCKKKKQNVDKEFYQYDPLFNIFETSIVLPIIKLKNDLLCISENKQINRLREEKKKQKQEQTGEKIGRKRQTDKETENNKNDVINDNEVNSILLRSKAFNETWKNINGFLDCYIYNYVNDMVNNEINNLNKNICLKNDTVCLAIVRTQTCDFVNMLQYKIICDQLAFINGGEKEEKGKKNGGRREIEEGGEVGCQENVCEHIHKHTFFYENSNKELILCSELKSRKTIVSCIINVYSSDSIDSIIIRILKNISDHKKPLKIDHNNMHSLFQTIVKKKKHMVLIIFIKNYINIKSSIFSALLLYLTHIKDTNLINIGVIVTNSSILSALNNLDFMIKKHVNVTICNMYINYYHLLEHIIFNPLLLHNVLYRLKSYQLILDYIYYYNSDITFLKIKYFIYMFLRDFYDKKILSFLSISLTYFSNTQTGGTKKGAKKKYTNENALKVVLKKEYEKSFKYFNKELVESLNNIDIQQIHNKFILLFYASNFYSLHINHLKKKGNCYTQYMLNELSKKKKKNQHLDDDNGNSVSRHNNKNTNYDKYNEILKDNKVEIINARRNQTCSKRKREDDYFYNCIKNFGCTNYCQNINNNDNGGKNYNPYDDYNDCNHDKISSSHDSCAVSSAIRREDNSKDNNHNSEKDIKLIHEIIHLSFQNNLLMQKLKIMKQYKNYYYQNYSLHNLCASLSPIKTQVNNNILDDCSTLKQHIINNLHMHMKQEHKFDSLKILQKEWRNNEYVHIYKYEKIAKQLLASYESTCHDHNSATPNHTPINTPNHSSATPYHAQIDTSNNSSATPNKFLVNISNNAINQDNYRKEKNHIKKLLILNLHNNLAKSISKKMIILLYIKQKYSICLAIIDIILKNMPVQSSLRKRVNIIIELFQKYEQKHIIQDMHDLNKANGDIEKELKNTLNTICDILINLYFNKIDTFKKVLSDICTLLQSLTYVYKLEDYIYKNKKSESSFTLSMYIFFQKLNDLIKYINMPIDLIKENYKNFNGSKRENSCTNFNHTNTNCATTNSTSVSFDVESDNIKKKLSNKKKVVRFCDYDCNNSNKKDI
ncbi:conserved protein, unknown function, partial [Hepatocystis sp. ex Piliocolobus tephrosceles]